MLIFLALAATSAAPVAVPPELQLDIACVVTIARAAPGDTALDAPGREYAAIIGADIIDTTGRTREQARDLFAQALKLPQNERNLSPCKQRMTARLLDGKLPEPDK